MKCEVIQPLYFYLLDPLTKKYIKIWSSVINFVDRFPVIKQDLPSRTLILILSLEQGVGIRALQHKK